MKESECVVSRILTKILRQKMIPAPCFEPSTFRLALLLTLVWGDLAVAAIATVSVASKQTQSLYILKD